MNENTQFEYEVLIREFHLDSFGHVNNAAYVQLYEEARWDFITKNGFGLDYVQKHQIGPVILDLQVRFKRELKNRETIKILSRTLEIVSPKIMVLEQSMIKADGKVASEATFTVGFFDMKERKLISANEDWLKACGVKLK
ncbi:acyl-CoA thioesterase [Peredibacter starrii]|uniref:Acyl-CoA thioesterase n=1 Tax=Peredibacter starrii TaxID=28202 RepID=A0AAX4HSS6_9BACT|nr:acyl-CoA thioesterase [Peredibacter starrii]WPU66344.1 acyl-CoA thioesterase [Peredibacter starrii]